MEFILKKKCNGGMELNDLKINSSIQIISSGVPWAYNIYYDKDEDGISGDMQENIFEFKNSFPRVGITVYNTGENDINIKVTIYETKNREMPALL